MYLMSLFLEIFHLLKGTSSDVIFAAGIVLLN